MNKTFDIPPADTIPSPDRVLQAQGVPTSSIEVTRYREIAQDAISRYRQLAAPETGRQPYTFGDKHLEARLG